MVSHGPLAASSAKTWEFIHHFPSESGTYHFCLHLEQKKGGTLTFCPSVVSCFLELEVWGARSPSCPTFPLPFPSSRAKAGPPWYLDKMPADHVPVARFGPSLTCFDFAQHGTKRVTKTNGRIFGVLGWKQTHSRHYISFGGITTVCSAVSPVGTERQNRGATEKGKRAHLGSTCFIPL